jgi:uncharacterized protein (TIGR02594 family)
MSLPEKYKWLEAIGTLPKTISIGLTYLGTRETVGKGSNRTIMEWRDRLNHGGVMIDGYSDDDIPWCGLFVAWVTYCRGDASEVVQSPLWARNWLKYGKTVATPMLGDVLVFSRNGGGHVGFYIAEDASAYHVLGGNQSNAVTITRIEKARCIGSRRPLYKNQPSTVKPYIVAASGTLSKNES